MFEIHHGKRPPPKKQMGGGGGRAKLATSDNCFCIIYITYANSRNTLVATRASNTPPEI